MTGFHIHTAINPSDVYPVPGCDECLLMAAARDMLAALESIEEQIRLIGIEDWHGAEGLDVSIVRAAIAKARGQN